MSTRFVRIVSAGEWDHALRTRALPPNRDSWHEYGPGEVVFLHRESVPFHWLLSYVGQTFDREAGDEVHLILVDLSRERALTLRPDGSSTYSEAVVHPGPIPLDDDSTIRRIATFYRSGDK